MTICFKHMEYLHFFIDSCVPSLFYTVRIVLVMQSDNVFIILKHACEQATFWSQKVEFQNVLMSMLISIPETNKLHGLDGARLEQSNTLPSLRIL